jgi:hypothetical protein
VSSESGTLMRASGKQLRVPDLGAPVHASIGSSVYVPTHATARRRCETLSAAARSGCQDVGMDPDLANTYRARADRAAVDTIFLLGAGAVCGAVIIASNPGSALARFEWIESSPIARAATCVLLAGLGAWFLYLGVLGHWGCLVTMSTSQLVLLTGRGRRTFRRSDISTIALLDAQKHHFAEIHLRDGRVVKGVGWKPEDRSWPSIVEDMNRWLLQDGA